jgi:transcriptional regulator GlxA family with amidase domain
MAWIVARRRARRQWQECHGSIDSRQMHQVAVLALESVVAFDLATPAQVFRGPYGFELCAVRGGPVATSTGFAVVADHGLEALARADTVIVPGYDTIDRPPPAPALEALRAAHARGARMVSICTGAFALAHAGLLDGRRATTHWRYAAQLAERFPAVDVDPDVLYVDEGDVLTSAGVAAGIDLCLHIVRRDHGSEVANAAARRCVVPPWRDGGQAQFIQRTLPPPDGASTSTARAWALGRLHEPLDLAAMAAHARMSVRSFTRRFRHETGLSPSQWLTGQRVEHARLLLETTDLAIDEVARQAGFGTSVSLRQHLHAAVGVAPLAYRRTFRATPRS